MLSFTRLSDGGRLDANYFDSGRGIVCITLVFTECLIPYLYTFACFYLPFPYPNVCMNEDVSTFWTLDLCPGRADIKEWVV